MEEKMGVITNRPLRRPSAIVIPRRTWMTIRAVAITSSCLVILLLIALVALVIIHTSPPYCSSGRGITARNLDNPGIFDDLTPREMEAVRDYVLAQSRLGLTRYEDATVNSSYIFLITLQTHLKGTVLKFQKGNERRPGRAAKVVVYRGNQVPPRVEEYLVGPLPKPRYARQVMSPVYQKVPIPFSSRPMDSVERNQLREFLYGATEDLYQLFQESYGLSYHNCTPEVDCIVFHDFGPRGTESGERMTWLKAYRDTDGLFLHPLGLAIEVDHKDTDPTLWSVTKVIYFGQLFYEIDDLAQRYSESTLRKIKQTMDMVDAQFSTYGRRGHESFDSPSRGPRLIEPDGHRYSIDEQFVQYFGWSFSFQMRTTTGLHILDVYFQGEKIAHELSLQEITTFYSGYTPYTSWLALYGVSWMLGASSYELVPGVDCPATASLIDTYHFVNSGRPLRYKNSICVFEQTSGIPLRRHHSRSSDRKFSSYGGLSSSSLVARTIVSLWTSDFIVDYVFYLDGSIELRTSVSGYVQASYNIAGEGPYGNRIHENIRGNLHQHLFHWKVDLDVGDVTNRYQTLDLDTESKSDFHYEGVVNTTQLKFNPVLHEDEQGATEMFDDKTLRKHIIYNNDFDNRFGTARAYEIINKAKSPFLLQHSNIANAASWARYKMAVTKYKDTEDSSSSIYAQGDPYDPVLDFSRYLTDNDSIVDEDLIFWVTTGHYHIPHAEDVPSSSTTGGQDSVFLKPYNFFNHCPSLAVSDAIRVRPGDGSSGLEFHTFGRDPGEPQCYQKERSLNTFSGDIDPL